MNRDRVCVGIDTSCYTTSVALCAADDGGPERPFLQQRQPLSVPAGQRGLKQSQMVFEHVTHLPHLMEALMARVPNGTVATVCASTRPRPAEGSYMPVFRVAEGTGRSVAAALGVPFFATSHQQGHLRAARVGTALDARTPCLMLQLSGGTTEVLAEADGALTVLGGTGDLNAGQLIDRIGVALGLPFPAGPQLEALAERGEATARLPVTVKGMVCHFSGAETAAMRWVDTGELPPAQIAAEVFSCVARTVAKLVDRGCRAQGVQDALLGGGVASSALLGRLVRARVSPQYRLHFARPELAGDNAVGVAMIGAERLAATL